MLRPLPWSYLLANSWFMNSFRVKPRCWNTPVSLYCAKTTSSGDRAAAEPTAIPSSPAETCLYQYTGYIPNFEHGRVTYHVETETALSLRLEHDRVHNINCISPLSATCCQLRNATKKTPRTRNHVLIPRQQLLVRDVQRCLAFIHNHTIGIHDSVRGNGRILIWRYKRHLRRELAVDGARKLDAVAGC